METSLDLTKEDRMSKARREYPKGASYVGRNKSGDWVTPELVKKVIDLYSTNTTKEIVAKTGVGQNRIAYLIQELLSRKVIVKKVRSSLRSKLDSAIAQLRTQGLIN